MNTRVFAFRRLAFAALFALLSAGLLATVTAQEKDPAAAPAQNAEQTAKQDLEFLAPFLNDSSFVIVKVDPTKISAPDLQAVLPLDEPDSKEHLKEMSDQLKLSISRFQVLADGKPIYAVAGFPASQNSAQVRLFREVTNKVNTDAVTALFREFMQTEVEEKNGVLTTALGRDELKLKGEFSAAQAESLQKAFATVDAYPVQVLVIPPTYLWRTVDELSPELPKEFGGGPSRVLTQGVQWAALGVNPEKLEGRLIFQSENEKAAGEFAALLPRMVTSAVEHSGFASQVPPAIVDAAFARLKPETVGDRVEVQVDLLSESKEDLKVLAAIASTFDKTYRRNTQTNKFKMLMLAMHNYHDTQGSFPVLAKYRDADGKPFLSWRVHLLPYLGQMELYNQFHLDEPWDSEHNKPLLMKMPDVFARNTINPAERLPIGMTTFLAPISDDTVYGGKEPTRLQDITDGTSNTIVVVDVKPENAVPWTAPQDYAFNPKNPMAGISRGKDDGWMAAFGDGSVQFLSGDIAPGTVLKLFEMSDGQVIGPLK